MHYNIHALIHWRQFGLKCGGDRDAIWNAFLEVLGMHLIFL